MRRRTAMLGRLTVVGAISAAVLMLQASMASAAGGGTWTALASVPSVGEGVEGMSAGVINGQLIAAFGFDPGTQLGDTDTTRVYDIASNTWSIVSAHVPGGPRSEAGSVVVNNKLYVIGGGIRAGVLPYTTVFDPSTGKWTALSALPDIVNKHGRSKPDRKAGLAVAAVGTTIYAFGGRYVPDGPCSPQHPEDVSSTVEKYNISTDKWTLLKPLPQPTSDAAAIAVNGEIYLFGGCTVSINGAGRYYQDVWKYDPPTDTWTKVGEMPGPPGCKQSSCGRAGFGQITAIGTTVYVIGGWNGNSNPPLPDVIAFDTTTGNSTLLAPMTHPRAEMGVALFNGSIYTVGGELPPALGSATNNTDKFTP